MSLQSLHLFLTFNLYGLLGSVKEISISLDSRTGGFPLYENWSIIKLLTQQDLCQHCREELFSKEKKESSSQK